MQRGPVVNARWFAGIPIAALLGIGPLGAADLPLKKTIVVAQAWSWTGLYGGFHTGLGLGMAEFSNPYSDFGTIIYGNNVPSPAALIGGQVGYNYQVGRWVTGIEADASWLSSDGTNTCFAVSGLFLSSTCRVQSDFLGTVTARVGLAAGPQGQTLFYGKGGAAFMHQDIHVVRNAGVAGPGLANLTNQPLFSSGVDLGTDTMRVGWTAGVGVEQAVTPAWSLKFEYDYQRFSGRDAVTPETSNLVSLGPPDAPFATFQVVPARTTSIQQDFHTFKVGVNYRIGGNSSAIWEQPGVLPAYPIKAAPVITAWSPGWEFAAGPRYWYNIGRSRLDVGVTATNPDPADTNISRLTYESMHTQNGELFGRINSPYRVFAKGFVGGGHVTSGNMHDEDWPLFLGSDGFGQYSNTNSPSVTGTTKYATIDLGYTWLRGPTFKSGVFVGYNYVYEKMNTFGCVELAGPLTCVPPRPTNVLNITESDTWNSLQIGAAAEFYLAQCNSARKRPICPT